MSRVITFGEIMMRLNPEGYLRLSQAERFEVTYAGGEANVAVSLANYGDEVTFVSAVPMNEIGQNAINALRRYGVDTTMIHRRGSRLGIYFVEKGASQRGSKVIYDRLGSSFALSKRLDFDWGNIFTQSDWFHFTGITPALGGELPDICLDAAMAAKKQGLTVSCDLNYRAKLWTKEAASQVMSKLMPHIDICIANEEDCADVFGLYAPNTDIKSGKIDLEGYKNVAEQLMKRFGLKKVAITLRGSVSASDNNWMGILYDGRKVYSSKNYKIHIVDRVGGGDSFAGGLIHAIRRGLDNQTAIEFATAASCLKQTIEFDFNLVQENEVFSLMGGNASGRVQR